MFFIQYRKYSAYLINTHDIHGGICRGGGDDDFLGTSLKMGACFVDGQEDTSGLNNVVGTRLSPLNLGGVFPVGVLVGQLLVL